jgi:serpin B
MLVFLPKEIAGLAELEKNLTAESLREWTRGLRRHKVSVFLPRFQMTSQFGLKDALVAMGMRLPFEPGRADFSGMSTADELFLSAVVHKAYVEVSEEGTEAAAATGAVVGVTSLPFGELTPPTFRADHPFAFAVRDNASGSLLFLGRVVSP